MLHIYNSLTRREEPFTPLTPGKVRLYACGMTVYDYMHVGHARVWIVFDVVVRYLRARGYEVEYVRNITDIDDKIIKRAAERGENIAQLTTRYIDALHEDERALGLLAPNHEPRATHHIGEIVDMIRALVDRGYTYRAANGDVYYRVRRFPSYGALSGQSPDDLRAGARIEVGEAKEDPLDFVLWKAAKASEPSWPSPWGPGRPGWHIECSAMSTKCLGEHFDIHGGGMDLKFPHHENEIAQSEAATGHKFVNYWMHVGFVRVNQEKMSKSLGNFFTVREVLGKFAPEVLRYFILTSHYRSPLDYSDQQLEAAKRAMDGYYLALRGLSSSSQGAGEDYARAFHEAMEHDFNTPKAFATLSALTGEINRAKASNDAARAAGLAATLKTLGGTLGLLQQDPEEYLRWRPSTVGSASGGAAGASHPYDDAQVETLIAQRIAARKAKNYAESDRIRDELKRAGIILEDSAAGTTWRRG
ncbi:MAG: cysteine--tRNA ligase [Sulfurifustis sp.]